jgi:Domain of unknown function (DUF1918)
MPAGKTTAKNAKAKKTTARSSKVKKTTAGKRTAKTSTSEQVTGKKATTKAGEKASGRSATSSRRASSSAMPARPGDLIVIDSPQVGSPAREGEILKVMVGAFSVSYQVRWGDGRETTISPGGGTARIIRT